MNALGRFALRWGWMILGFLPALNWAWAFSATIRTIQSLPGCQVNEAFARGCILGGVDISSELASQSTTLLWTGLLILLPLTVIWAGLVLAVSALRIFQGNKHHPTSLPQTGRPD